MVDLKNLSIQDSTTYSRGPDKKLVPPPDYLQHRIRLYDKYKAEYDKFIAEQPKNPIKITLPDGRQMDGTSFVTTPLDIAKMISSSLANRVVIAKVDGKLFDTVRVLEKDCSMELLDFDHPEVISSGKQVFWHSSAHVLGEACECHYGCHLSYGPPTVNEAQHAQITELSKQMIKEKQPFERLELDKSVLLEMFAYNPYKVHFITTQVPDNGKSTVYRCGEMIDFCLGPHIPNTGRIKAFQVKKNSSSYFLGDSKNDVLQRIYGISFPETKMLTEYNKFLEEAAKRDHRKIGRDQQLFFFHELSPGSCFFLPHGTRIYNKLVDFIRAEYRKRGFSEVVTPNMYNVRLWEQSGHWQNYKENMFSFEVEESKFALKPMNCPGHCLMFGHTDRSYKELPIRYADFGVLHRNEYSGALSGLTRVRRFQQDDAHIFCRVDQIKDEIVSCLEFMKSVYSIFGFTYSLALSTRPEKYIGDLEIWNMAEQNLTNALNDFGEKWVLNPEDGAFYGPKIDITIKDALNRNHQCATIQLDFQMPIRFQLEYVGTSGKKQDESHRPVIIHRAILGSVERMFAILTENYGGKWPLWLSPKQVLVIPVSAASNEYAESIRKTLHEEGFYVDADLGDNTLNKKIRSGEVEQYNFILVVGKKEEEDKTVNARQVTKEQKDQIFKLEDFIKALHGKVATKEKDNIIV